MNIHIVLLQAASSFLSDFWYQHPYISIIITVFVIREVSRWFVGTNTIRQAQDRTTEQLERQNDLLEKLTRVQEDHASVLSRLRDKYL